MADEFIEIGGKKVYKSLFKDAEGFEKLKAAQTSSSQMGEAWAEKQAEQEKSAFQEMTLPERAKIVEQRQAAATKPIAPTPPTPGAPSEDEQALAAEAKITAEQAAPPQPPPQAPTVMVATPAMIQETAISRVMQSPEAKQAVKSYEQATQASIEANKQKAEFEVARSNQMAVEKERIAQQTAQDFAEVKKNQQEYQSRLSEQVAKMSTTAQELSNYKFKEFFEGREGARVMAGISVALGAVGSAFTKGPNFAMEIIQNAIQNDLALQKANYEKLKGSFESQQTMYGQLRQRGLDDLATSQTFIKIRNDQAIQQMEAAASKISDPEAKARIDAMAAQMRQDGAKAIIAATEGLKTTVQTQIKQAPKPAPLDVLKARGDFEERVKKSPVGEASAATNAAEKFRAIVKAGAGEQALVDFVAGKGGLGQGSVNASFLDLMNKQGFVDKAGNVLRDAFKGGVNPATLNKIQSFLDAASVQATQDAMGHIPTIAEEAQMLGLDPNIYLGRLNQKTIQRMQYERAGARRLNK